MVVMLLLLVLISVTYQGLQKDLFWEKNKFQVVRFLYQPWQRKLGKE